MSSVSIEQSEETRDTYFRVKDVGRLLGKPQIKIRRLDTNEMLGPEGWKKQDLAHIVRQTLDRRDLLLEIESKLVSYIDPGRAIELQVDELQLTEDILPGELFPYPRTKASQSGTIFVEPKHGGFDPMVEPELPVSLSPPKDPNSIPPSPPSGASENKPTMLISEGAGTDTKLQGAQFDGTGQASRGPGEKSKSPDGEGGGKSGDGSNADPVSVGRSTWLALAFAGTFIAGAALGYLGKLIAEEYHTIDPTISQSQVTRLEAAAFAPLNPTLRQVEERSPAGVSPDTVAPRSSPDRARLFYVYGQTKALENNKTEAIYWYKQSVRTCDVNSLTYLGDALVFGEGLLPSDARTGFQLLRLATALGNEEAKRQLIRLLEFERIPGSRKPMAAEYQ